MTKRILLLTWLVLLTALTIPAQTVTETTQLKQGTTFERELKGAEKHSYSFESAPSKFVHLAVDQKGVDVVVTLYGRDGTKLQEVDGPTGTNGREPIWTMLSEAGNYRVDVAALDADAKPGRYAITLVEMLDANDDLRRFVDAKKIAEEAVAIRSNRDDPDRIRKVAEKLDEMLLIAASITGEKAKKASLYAQIGNLYRSVQQWNAALLNLDKAIALYLEINMKRETIQGLMDTQALPISPTDFIVRNERIRQLAIEIGDRGIETGSLMQIGRGYWELGNYPKAVESTRGAIAIAVETNDLGRVAGANANLGVILTEQGNLAAALESLQTSVEIESSRSGGKVSADTILNIGNVYMGLGSYDLAIATYQKALTEFEKMKAPVGIAYATSNIGSAYLDAGDLDKALDYFLLAQPMKAKLMEEDPTSYYNLSEVYRRKSRFAEAAEYAAKAIEMTRRSGDSAGLTKALTVASDIGYDSKGYAKALEYALEAVAIAEKNDNRPGLWSARLSAANAYLGLGRRPDARKSLAQAIGTLEDLRNELTGDETEHGRFFDRASAPYRMLIGMNVDEANALSALQGAEKIKARTLLDVLASGKAEINKSLTAQERRAETSLRDEMASLNLQIGDEEDETKLPKLKSELEAKRLEYEDFKTRLYGAHPELRAQRAELGEMRIEDIAPLLSGRSAAAEFVVDDEETYLLVIRKDAGGRLIVKSSTIPLGRDRLAAKVENLRSKIARGALDFQTASQELYDSLLRPADKDLGAATDLIIVPDGPLWELPFQALMDGGGKYLIDKMAISYAPSLTALREMSSQAKGKKRDVGGTELLAVGNPVVGPETSERVKRVFMDEKLEPLPEAERLVNELGRMYGPSRSKVFTGAAAKEDVAKSEAPKYRIVQFATHGILNNVSPMYSHLLLAHGEKGFEDGLLEAWELKDLNLNADMVILSACETARGKVSRGEGMIGMTWAAFIAGAPTTVASQWKVESRSTTELMLEFHRQLLKGKVSKAEAMRQAALKLKRTHEFSHPSYWAGFVVVGDAN